MTRIEVEPPSKQQLLKTTGIAAGIAIVVLFVAVLPAEFGIDPLRTGELLGLTDDDATVDGDPHNPSSSPMQEYTTTVELEPGSGWLESGLKIRLDEGDTILYEWQATGPLTVDLHTDATGSYSGSPTQSVTAWQGSLTTPVDGCHGWAINNRGDEPVTFTLTVTGFFDPETDIYRGAATPDLCD